MNHDALIDEYLAGSGVLRRAIAGMTREQLLARPIAGKWSTQDVVCHLADYEPIYADRMKRVIALDQPELLKGDPERFAASLAYDQREVDEELALIEITRKQMARILRTLNAADFERTGGHSRDGVLTLATLLERIAGHIPHHVRFIEEKRRVLESRLVEIYRAKDGIQAALIKNMLEDAGIRVRIEEDLLQGAYGLGYLSPRIVVFESDAAQARALLANVPNR